MAVRKRLSPNSVLQLVLVAFLIITLPLLLALGFATLKVDGLSRQSREAVYGAVQAIQAGRTIFEKITAMERSYRQYAILQDPALLDRYQEQRKEFRAAFALFANTPFDRLRTTRLRGLYNHEKALNQALLATSPADPQHGALLDRFVDLQQQAREIPVESYQVALREAQSLQQSADHSQRLLIILGLTLLPGTAALAALFTLFITRPLSQMDRAIRQLGNENLDTTIAVSGPKDLRELGDRLEWLRQRLLELEQQKLNFLRHISHDLKTPLTAIREGSELLNDNVLGSLNTAQMEVAGILAQNAKALQRQIEELLRFNEYRFRPRRDYIPISITKVLNKALSDHAIHIKSKCLALVSQINEGVILGEEGLLRIIFDNLISNAIKYTPHGGNIKVSSGANGEHYEIHVKDSGLGIPEHERRKVFEAFYRGNSSKRSNEQGSGLGLAIAAEYTRHFGGDINILESKSGAHFRLRIPLYKLHKKGNNLRNTKTSDSENGSIQHHEYKKQ